MTTKLPHADLICQHVQTGEQIWVWSRFGAENYRWGICSPHHLLNHPDLQYAIGDKPTAPPPAPVKYATLAGSSFPVPMSEAPRQGDIYYFMDIEGIVCSGAWANEYPYLKSALANHSVHATREGCEAYGRAIQAAVKQAIEAAV